jgi:hypothetical protein
MKQQLDNLPSVKDSPEESCAYPELLDTIPRYMHYTPSLLAILTAALLLVVFGCGLGQDQPDDTIEKPVIIPTQYRAHRFLATPVTSQGDTLNFITDSGENSAFIFEHEARRLNLTDVDYEATGMYSGISKEFGEVEMPPFQENTGIPPPSRQGAFSFRSLRIGSTKKWGRSTYKTYMVTQTAFWETPGLPVEPGGLITQDASSCGRRTATFQRQLKSIGLS